MALGVPVACSDRASLPEVAGDAGIVRPLNLDAWSDIPLLMEARREALVAKGYERAQQFTSRVSGDVILAVYEKCLSR
jgi:glycosyltransferase involved in cell wall biosynthesis